MPSEMMNPRDSPSYFLPEEAHLSDERQTGVWKMDHNTGYYGLKTDGTVRNSGEYYLGNGRNVNLSMGNRVVAAERAASHSSPSGVDRDLGVRTNLNRGPASYFVDGDKMNFTGSQYENSLFSSSMSEVFSRKLILPSNNSAHGHSFGAPAPHYEEEEPFESLEELEAQTIGNLLPDDDELLSGVTDGFNGIHRPINNGEEIEDFDLFSSVGGLELGEDGPSQRNSDISFCGEHPLGEHPSRTLFVRNINSNVEDSELKMIFEQFGEIHTLYTTCKHRGFVMISYFDLRAAREAMKALQNKPFRRRKLDIHYSIPKENPSEKDINQGILAVFNLDSSVSNDQLREIFGAYGAIMEIRGTPQRSNHKFVEFYDVRAAENALHALNRSVIAGKQIHLEMDQPGGSKRLVQSFSSELEQEEFSVNPLLDNVFHSSSFPNNLASAVRVKSGNHHIIGESGHLGSLLKFDLHGTPTLHPRSVPECHDGLASWGPFGPPSNMGSSMITARPPEIIDNQQFRRVGSNGQSIEMNEGFVSSVNGISVPPGRPFMWSNSHHPQPPQAIIWPNSSPSFLNRISAPHPQHLNAIPRVPPSHMLNTLVVPLNNHHVGSAPSINLWERRHTYATGESPDAAVFHPVSLGNMRVPGNTPHPMEFVPHNIFSRTIDVSKSNGLHPYHQRGVIFPTRGQNIPVMGSFDSPNERTRNRRNEGNSSQGENKKQFDLDVDRILRGEDKRTTLMLKNIPNKYTSKMLLAAIDERHRGTYDFIYLPIDFKNKCNVGYAFINMTDPSLIVPFFQTFNGKKWEKFNSEKVASLAYARIQGKSALIAHFQNSSLMNEDKRCRPILFHTDGPNAGDQVPFPMGANIRPRSVKIRGSTSEENNQEMPPNSPDDDEYFNGDPSSGSGK